MVAQLGRTLAESGSRTVILELDLRKPMLADGFGIDQENGLSLFLSGHLNPLPKIHSTDIPNLHLIAAGPRPPNPLALIQSERLEFLFKELGEVFRFILVDSPPLLTVADARVLGTRVDGSVLVVRAGTTPRKLVQRARNSLQHAGANVIGMILNGANMSRDDSYYYKYYRDASYYGAGEG
jgi:capsular exopolysaccharide synthesis family protein